MRRMIASRRAVTFALMATPAAADPGPSLDRAAAWRALDEFRAALAEYDAALRLAPNRPDILAERALTLHRLGETEAARIALDAVIAAAGPGDGAPYAARAGLELLMRQDMQAEADLAEALRRTPDDPRALDLQRLLAARHGTGRRPNARGMEALRQVFGPWLSE